jgi:hypothetical protein
MATDETPERGSRVTGSPVEGRRRGARARSRRADNVSLMTFAVRRFRTLAFSLIALAGLSGPARAICLSVAVGPGGFPGSGFAIVVADRQTILTTLLANPGVKPRTFGPDRRGAADINLNVTVVAMSEATQRPDIQGIVDAIVDPHANPGAPIIRIVTGRVSGTDREGVLYGVGNNLLDGASALRPW